MATFAYGDCPDTVVKSSKRCLQVTIYIILSFFANLPLCSCLAKDQDSDLNIHDICKQFVQKSPCGVEKAYNFFNCN